MRRRWCRNKTKSQVAQVHCRDFWELEPVLRPCRSQRGHHKRSQQVNKFYWNCSEVILHTKSPSSFVNLGQFLQSPALRQEDVLKCPGLSVAPMARHYSATLQMLTAHVPRIAKALANAIKVVRLSFSSDGFQKFCIFSMSRASRRPMRLSHVKPNDDGMICSFFEMHFMICFGFPFTWESPKVGQRLWKMPKSLGTSEMLRKPWRCPQIPCWSFECLFLAETEFWRISRRKA